MTELRDNTFYASITISMNGSELEIDSRPSDAIALAVRTQAPIFAADDVIDESSIEFEHEVEDTEEVVEKFKDFLDQVTPEDFAKGEEYPPGRLVAGSSVAEGTAPRDRARSRIRPHRSSKEIPAASAAIGSSEVSVSPGIAFASSTWGPSRAEDQVDSPEALEAERVPCPHGGVEHGRPRRLPSSAGQTYSVRPIS